MKLEPRDIDIIEPLLIKRRNEIEESLKKSWDDRLFEEDTNLSYLLFRLQQDMNYARP